MPCASRRSRMCGTAAADSSLLTVTRTNSDPARANALTCATVPSISAGAGVVLHCPAARGGAPLGAGPPLAGGGGRTGFHHALYLRGYLQDWLRVLTRFL